MDRCHAIRIQKTKALIAVDTMSTFPDHNRRYDIYTDTSDFQLGTVLIQEGRPVAYYLRSSIAPK